MFDFILYIDKINNSFFRFYNVFQLCHNLNSYYSYYTLYIQILIQPIIYHNK